MEYNPTDINALDAKEAEREEQRKKAQDTEATDVKWLMKQRAGRRIVWRLLEQAHVFQSSFNTNALTMAFNEGNRNYGNRLLALVQRHSSEFYLTMVEEANERTKPSGG